MRDDDQSCPHFSELGKNQEALDDATQAFSRDPSSGQAAFLMGRSHRLLGSFYEAIDAFAAAERLSAQGTCKLRTSRHTPPHTAHAHTFTHISALQVSRRPE